MAAAEEAAAAEGESNIRRDGEIDVNGAGNRRHGI